MRRVPLATSLALLGSAILAAPASAAILPFGDTSGQQQGYTGVSAGPDGSAYVYNDTRSVVERYDRAGTLLASWGGRSSAGVPGKFHDLIGLTVTPTDVVWAAENTGGRLQRFTSTGSLLGTTSGGGESLASNSLGELYAGWQSGLVKFDASGQNAVAVGGGLGVADGDFALLRDIDVDRTTDQVYAVDEENGRVQVFDRDGAFLRKWGTQGTGPGQFDKPWAIAAGPAGVFVGEANNDRSRVQRFDAAGNLLGQFVFADAGIVVHTTDLALDGDQLIAVGHNRHAYRIDIGKPFARVASGALAGGTFTGDEITYDASGSGIPFGDRSSLRFKWDLDGDGTFEQDTGATPKVTTTVRDGENRVAVRVTSGGSSDTAAVTVSSLGTRNVDGTPGPGPGPGGGGTPTPTPTPTPTGPKPPAGPVGVTVNDGAQYTNDPDVTVDVVWPLGASTLLLANDGGFRAAKGLPVAATVRWTLASSGPERLPKTVYVRFGASSQTFTDDIILDQTAPTLSSASFGAGTTAKAAAAKPKSLKLRASDKTSGVKQVELAAKKGGKVLQRSAYRASVKVTKSAVKWVRVRDGAGNASAWRRIGR